MGIKCGAGTPAREIKPREKKIRSFRTHHEKPLWLKACSPDEWSSAAGIPRAEPALSLSKGVPAPQRQNPILAPQSDTIVRMSEGGLPSHLPSRIWTERPSQPRPSAATNIGDAFRITNGTTC